MRKHVGDAFVPGSGTDAGPLSHSLIGEYATMLLVAHVGFIAIAWGCYGPATPVNSAIIAAAIWTALRLAGGFSGRIFTPAISLTLLITTLLVSDSPAAGTPAWLVSGPFSAWILVAIAGLVAALDVLDLVDSRGHQLAALAKRFGVRVLLYGLLGFLVSYAFIVPVLQEMAIDQTARELSHIASHRMTLRQTILFNLAEGLSGLLFLTVGAVVGSFLNVVIYRVPIGKSVVSEPSHCPHCRADISAWDNLPLVGWLRLNGQCRNCGIAIPSRYPAVEGTIALVFLLLYFVELISGGTNLPVRSPNMYAGVQWILFYTKWDLVGLYVFHCFLICTLFTWAMMLRDANRVPLKSIGVAVAIALACPLLQPHLLPWPYDLGAGDTPVYSVPDAAMTALMGLLAASAVLLVLAAARRAWGAGVLLPAQLHPASWLMIGVCLGWQATIGIALFLGVWMAGCGLICPREREPGFGPPSIRAELRRLALPSVVLLHQCLWRSVSQLIA